MISFGNITAHGVVYQLPDVPPSNLVWVDPKEHTNYWCSVQGDTSGSSSSPRTEGRETLPNSGEPYNWVYGSAVHRMSGVVRVEMAPSSGKVIVGQLHAYKAPNPFVMVTWWNGVARVDMRNTPNDDARKVISVPCPLSKAFKYIIEVNTYDMLYVNLNGVELYVPVQPEWEGHPFFFKAGAYVIDNVGELSEGGWVVYEQFDVFNGEIE